MNLDVVLWSICDFCSDGVKGGFNWGQINKMRTKETTSNGNVLYGLGQWTSAFMIDEKARLASVMWI